MRYILAVLCPPLAIARAQRPLQAIAATFGLVLAALTWSTGLGVMIAALLILWASRVVGDREALDEVRAFSRTYYPHG